MSAASSRTLTGAVVLITGAGGGIGRALCAAFAEAGARVVGSDIGERPGNATVDAWLRATAGGRGMWWGVQARPRWDCRQRYSRNNTPVSGSENDATKKKRDGKTRTPPTILCFRPLPGRSAALKPKAPWPRPQTHA